MENKQEILEELEVVSPFLALAERTHPYVVSPVYFENLSSMVVLKIKETDQTGNTIYPSYTVPDDFFDGLAESILSKINVEVLSGNQIWQETAEIAPLLNSISKQPVYTVPAGYFDQLEITGYAGKPEQKIQGRVFKMKTYNRWIQYAAVAMVAGILVTGAFLFTDSNSYIEHEKKGHLDSTIPERAKEEEVMQKDTGTIGEEAQNTADEEESGSTKINPGKPNRDIRSHIRLLSDEELKQYLEQNEVPEPVIISDNTETEDSL